MHQIKKIFVLLPFFLLLNFCIEPYSFNPTERSAPKIVIYGNMTDKEGYQQVSISTSSTVSDPEYLPLNNCSVKIIDNLGNEFPLNQFDNGLYRVWVDSIYLLPGRSYKVNVVTEEGLEIESSFDQIHECPEIDTIYFKLEGNTAPKSDKSYQRVQFYTNLDGKDLNTRFYRWELVEAWEHHASYPLTWLWDGRRITRVEPTDYSKMVCWTIQNVAQVFTLSTKNLLQNKYFNYKLNFIDNQSQRLTYCYSLLINQYATSEESFNYWDKMRKNSSDQGGLYSTQPLPIKGNLSCVTVPTLEVLGFFGASSVRSKRIFVKDIPNFSKLYPTCLMGLLDDMRALPRGQKMYLYPGEGGLYIMDESCVECDRYSGTNIKPDFWPY